MKIINTYFDDIKIFEPIVHSDYRGFFMESFNHHIQQALQETFLQDSHSKSSKYVLRGLHYQWEDPMGKLIRVIKGRGLDIVIDVRKSSETYGEWRTFELSEDNHHILWVPAGFAHGFLCLEEDTHLCYKNSALHNAKCEGAINPINSGLDIDFPIPHDKIILSDKDRNAPSFDDYDKDPKF